MSTPPAAPAPEPGPDSGPTPDVVVEARVGEPVALPLADPGPVGYAWRYVLPDGLADAGSTEPVPPPAGQELGTSSGVRPLVVAARPGTFDVDAALARPWEDDEPPVRTVRLRVVATPPR